MMAKLLSRDEHQIRHIKAGTLNSKHIDRDAVFLILRIFIPSFTALFFLRSYFNQINIEKVDRTLATQVSRKVAASI